MIQYYKEVYKYITKNDNGEIPINKCLNDIYGVRIILEENVEYNRIQKFIKDNFLNLKCIDASKEQYKAIHIYFKKDNYSFPWELQIWNKSEEQSNKISHKNYKQEYTKWEQQIKKEE